MALFIVQCDAGMCGTEHAFLIEAENDDLAAREAYTEVEEWFWDFNDPNEFEDYEPELEYSVEPWSEELAEALGLED